MKAESVNAGQVCRRATRANVRCIIFLSRLAQSTGRGQRRRPTRSPCCRPGFQMPVVLAEETEKRKEVRLLCFSAICEKVTLGICSAVRSRLQPRGHRRVQSISARRRGAEEGHPLRRMRELQVKGHVLTEKEGPVGIGSGSDLGFPEIESVTFSLVSQLLPRPAKARGP